MRVYTQEERTNARIVANLVLAISDNSISLSHLTEILEVTKEWGSCITFTYLKVADHLGLIEMLADEHGVVSIYHMGESDE